MSDYIKKDCLALSLLLKKGDCSPKELLEECIQVQNSLGVKVNALSNFSPEFALESIAQDKEILRHSFFGGIPFLVKDAGIFVKDMKTTFGCENTKIHAVSSKDSDLIDRYKKCGFVICGRTNTSEFGLAPTTEPVFFGATSNPWNYNKSAGGSSGGSAAAVASGIVPIAHGADGGGSIRVPASCCGLFGLKPTRGRIEVEIGQSPGWGGFISHHVITRSVRDSAAVLKLTESELFKNIHDYCLSDLTYNKQAQIRIALGLSFNTPVFIDHEIIKQVEFLASELIKKRYIVESIDLQYDPIVLRANYRKHIGLYVKAFLDNKGVFPSEYPFLKNIETMTVKLLMESLNMGNSELIYINNYFSKLNDYFNLLFKRFDILITPSLATLAPNIGYFSKFESSLSELHDEYARFSPFTIPFNINGFPAASIPCGKSREGTPIGLQVVGGFGNDKAVLRMASEIEKLGLYDFSKEVSTKKNLLELI